MAEFLNHIGVAVGATLLSACATPLNYAPAQMDEPLFTERQAQEDFDAFLDFVRETHPKLDYSADLDELDVAADRVRASLREGMTAREIWMAFAVMNPKFADAHVGLRRPVAALETFEKSGGKLFPAPIVIDSDERMRIGEASASWPGVAPGDEVLSINGIASRDIISAVSPRMRGETEKLGRLVMERYFAEYFWIAYGAYDQYVVRVKNKDGAVRIVALDAASEGAAAEDIYAHRVLEGNVGYLDVPSFNIRYQKRFAAFLETAFTDFKNKDVDRLVIDLRENTGGAHDVSDLLMAYLTDRPYSAISGVTARITEENIALIPGASLGDVISVPFQQTITPQENFPLRFEGEVYALIGGLTYSQAIAFATTLQDYEVATLAGEETEGPGNQTGQVQLSPLPNTGIEALAPIYIFVRANGDKSRSPVVPDIVIKDDSFDAMASVNALLKKM